MDKEELRRLMDHNSLNVKKTAAMLCVSQRTVYQWLDGSRAMPEMAVELLRLKLKEFNDE